MMPASRASRASRASLFALALLSCLACGGSDTPSQPSFHLAPVAGAGQSDSAAAFLPQPVTVQLTGAGAGAAGRGIRFTGITVPIAGGARAYTAYVAPQGETRYVADVVVPADADGRATVLVQLGTPAGPASLAVTDTASGVSDTVRFTIVAARPTVLALAPHDTTIAVGGTFPLRVTVTDRFGNPVAGATPAFSTLADGITLTGTTVAAPVSGAMRIIGAMARDSDTVVVRALPTATIAAFDSRGLNYLGLDGGVTRSDATLQHLSQPVFTPDGSEVLFEWSGIHAESATGNTTRTVVANTGARFPRVEKTGPWVHYSVEISDGMWELHRVHLDGTGDETIPVGDGGSALAGTVSPDGGQMVFVRPGQYTSWLLRLDLATHAVTPLDVQGHIPRWSPAGNLVAFTSMPDAWLMLMAPDGSQVRTLSKRGYYYTGFDWSPDGRWLIVRNGGLELFNVATGIMTVVPFSTELGEPTWKP